MPDVYLNPGDLSPAQAERVLAFLNRATSAKQLGRDIEFPDEPDIGVRLGQRLLDARAALGGEYTNILQVRAVRLIGPERFTEICVAALGLDPRRWVDLFFGAAPLSPPADIGLVVTIESRPQPAWLGQPLDLVLRVADRGGVPRAAVPVTVQAGAGRLVWMYGFQRVEGQAITVHTGADGSAVLELIRPPSEPLSDLQEAALRVALAELDVHAGDPFKLEADFRALADLYLLERSYNLRRAIDLYVRDHREAMLAALNPGAWRLAWPIDSVLLQADTVVDGGSSTARAVSTVVWKNWVGAWLEFLGDRLRETAGLDDNFVAALRSAKDPDVVTELLSQAQLLVASSSGRSALWVGQKSASDASTRLLSRPELAQAPVEVQAALLSQLPVAAKEITPTTLGSFSLAKTVPKGSLVNVDPKLLATVEALSAQVAGLNQQNAALTAQFTALQSNVTDVRGRLQLPPFTAPVIGPGGLVVGPNIGPAGGPAGGTVAGPVAGPTVAVGPGRGPVAKPAPRPARKRKKKEPKS